MNGKVKQKEKLIYLGRPSFYLDEDQIIKFKDEVLNIINMQLFNRGSFTRSRKPENQESFWRLTEKYVGIQNQYFMFPENTLSIRIDDTHNNIRISWCTTLKR